MWWANFPPPAGRRPAVLVSRSEAYDIRANVTVVPITRTRRDIPTEVPVGRAEGVVKDSVANADDVTTIPRRLLTERAGVLEESKLKAWTAPSYSPLRSPEAIRISDDFPGRAIIVA